MTERDWQRVEVLENKMERARDRAGRSYSTTDDLSVPERAEWHDLQVKIDIAAREFEAREDRQYRMSQLSSMMAGMDDEGGPYPRTDADMGL